jgi:hypothetical protein
VAILGRGFPVRPHIPEAVAVAAAAPVLVAQEGFRWRNDDGDEDGATWKAAQDTNASTALAAGARLRVLLDATGDVTVTPTLYYKKTSDSTWLPVPVGAAPQSVRFDAVGDRLSRAATDIGTGAVTMAGWAYIDVDRNSYSLLFGFDDGGSGWHQAITDTGGTSIGFSTGSSGANRYEVTAAATWYYVATVYNPSGTDYLYIGTTSAATTQYALAGSATSANSAWTFYIGNDNPTFAEWLNGRIAYCRVWSAALSQSEIDAERTAATAVRTTNLWADYPLQSNYNDISINARHLTADGTLAFSTGPSISIPNPVYIKTSTNITAGGEPTTAQLIPPVTIDSFTGTNGAAWNATIWDTADIVIETSGGFDIQSNAGRIQAGGGPYQGVAVRSEGSWGATDITGTVTFDSTNEAYFSLGLRTAATWGGETTPSQPFTGYSVERAVGGTDLGLFRYDGVAARTQLDTTTVSASAGPLSYRIYAVGSDIKAKYWSGTGADPSPGTWDLEATDATYASGHTTITLACGGAGTTRTATVDSLTFVGASFSPGRIWDDENGTDVVTI